MERFVSGFAAVLAVVLAVATAPAWAAEAAAQDAPGTAATEAAAARTAAAPAAGMRIHRDPTTGKLLERAPRRALPADLQRPDHGRLRPVRMPGHGVALDLQGQFRMATVVTRAPDGTLHWDCVQGADADHGGHGHAPVDTAAGAAPPAAEER